MKIRETDPFEYLDPTLDEKKDRKVEKIEKIVDVDNEKKKRQTENEKKGKAIGKGEKFDESV